MFVQLFYLLLSNTMELVTKKGQSVEKSFVNYKPLSTTDGGSSTIRIGQVG